MEMDSGREERISAAVASRGLLLTVEQDETRKHH